MTGLRDQWLPGHLLLGSQFLGGPNVPTETELSGKSPVGRATFQCFSWEQWLLVPLAWSIGKSGNLTQTLHCVFLHKYQLS